MILLNKVQLYLPLEEQKIKTDTANITTFLETKGNTNSNIVFVISSPEPLESYSGMHVIERVLSRLDLEMDNILVVRKESIENSSIKTLYENFELANTFVFWGHEAMLEGLFDTLELNQSIHRGKKSYLLTEDIIRLSHQSTKEAKEAAWNAIKLFLGKL